MSSIEETTSDSAITDSDVTVSTAAASNIALKSGGQSLCLKRHDKSFKKRRLNHTKNEFILATECSNIETSDSKSTTIQNKKSSPNDITTNRCTIFDITSVEDVFYNILSFFITDQNSFDNNRSAGSIYRNDNDTQSFYSIMCVSKEWYCLSTSTSFWTTFSKRHSKIHEVIDAHNTIGKRKFHETSFLSSLPSSRTSPLLVLKDEAKCFKKCRYFSTIDQGLIGFTKIHDYTNINCIKCRCRDRTRGLEISNCANESNPCYLQCYKVRERATSKIYTLKVLNKNQPCNYCDKTYPQDHMREVFALQRLCSNHHQNQCDGENNLRTCCHSPLFSMLIDWELRKASNQENYIFRFYQEEKDDAAMTSLDKFVKEYSKDFMKGGLNLAKHIIRQLLIGTSQMHQSGVVHRNLNCQNVVIYKKEVIHNGDKNKSYDLSDNFIDDIQKVESSFSVKIGDFSKCKGYYSTASQNILQNSELASSSLFSDAVNDLYSIYCIYEFILLELMNAENEHNDKRVMSIAVDSRHNKKSIVHKQASQLLKQLQSWNHNKSNVTSFFDFLYDLSLSAVPDQFIVEISNCKIKERFEMLKRNELGIQLDDKRTHATAEQWAKLVDWLFEIVDVLEKSGQTVFMAMGYVDLVLSKTKMVKRNQLQLLAATCLHIASKVEDEEAVSVTDLHYCADKMYDITDIVYLEEDTLERIEWNISSPTIHDFVLIYHECIGESNGKCFWLSHYLSELALQSTLYVKFPPSIIAASVIATSRYCVYRKNSFPRELETLSGYSILELGDCILTLSSFLSQRNPDLKIVAHRYSKTERGCVSKITLSEVKSVSDLEKMI